MLDSVQIILVVLCSIFIANYVYLRWSSATKRTTSVEMTEAFENQDDVSTAIYGIDHIYDDFYAEYLELNPNL